jgi:8-oxo-dGTP diphosphatase
MQKLNDLEPEIRSSAEHRPLSVKAVIVSSDDKILLLKRPREGRWDLPGGGVDDGESLAEAIVREIQEETGLLTDNALPIYTYLRAVNGKSEKLLQFVLTRVNAKASELNITLSDEHDCYAFFDHMEIRTLQIVPSYLEALRRARIELDKSHTHFSS